MMNTILAEYLLSMKKNKGSITFTFSDLDQLNKIISIIKSNY